MMDHPPIPPSLAGNDRWDGSYCLDFFVHPSGSVTVSLRRRQSGTSVFVTTDRHIIACVVRCAWADYAATFLACDINRYNEGIANAKAWRVWGGAK